MTPTDVPAADEPRSRDGQRQSRDSIEGLADIVARGDAAVTVLMDELPGSPSGPVDVRPPAGESSDAWTEQIASALGEVRGRIVAVTSERTGLAARFALGLAARLVEDGSPVTLVDGAIEEPVFSKGLPDDGDEGLVDAVLFGVSSSTIARRTLVHGVRLVTAGSYPISVPAVLGASAYATTLQKLAREDATVIVVLPASYAPVAAAAAAQLVVLARDVPALERLTGDLRSAEALQDVRFVAVLSAPEPVVTPFVDAGAAEDVAGPDDGDQDDTVSAVSEAAEPGITGRAAVTPALTPAVTPTVTPAVTSAATPAAARRKEAVGARPSRRWGALTAVVLVLIVAGVAWRTGLFEGLLNGEIDVPTLVVTQDERLPRVGADGQPGDTEAAGSSDESAGGSAMTVEAPGERPQGDETALVDAHAEQAVSRDEPDDAATAAVGDWRSRAVSTALPGRYVVFTSSHHQETAAERDAEILEGRGFPAKIVEVEILDRGTWHRVAVDVGFRTLDDTRELLDIMKEVGYEGAWIERLHEPAPPQVEAVSDTTDRWINGGGAPE